MPTRRATMRWVIESVDSAKVQEELPGLLNQLPQWRLEKAKSFYWDIDRYLCAKSFVMLQNLLESEFGIRAPIAFDYLEYGKPVLKGHPDVQFNLSHCRKAIACATDTFPIGIDVEEIRYDPPTAEMVLSEQELQTVRSSTFPALEFTRIWTMKESARKLTGLGISEHMKNVLSRMDIRFMTEVREKQGYVVSLAQYSVNSVIWDR